MLFEYTDENAKKLANFNFCKFAKPFPINLYWLRIVEFTPFDKNIYDELHSHSFFEIHFAFDGLMVYNCGNKTFNISCGEAIMFSPASKHCFVSENSNFKRFSIAFSVDENSELYDEINSKNVTVFRYSDEIIQNVSNMLLRIRENNIFSYHLINGIAFELIYNIFKCLNIKFSEDSSNSFNFDSRFSVAKEYIKNNINHNITSENVAKECGLSVKQLSRIFKKYTNQTLFDYIVKTKLNRAEELLTESNLTIKEIGYELGFENEYYFSSFFKRHSGMPPGCFINKNRNIKEV
ncbi:MAG: helix-turn-helix transcriptional regulator [Clostridia bacterium]|nr:helix-turn-helix transcriptional regulator [Clostridia bacterium]